jgi:Cu2+-exporting ATPase
MHRHDEPTQTHNHAEHGSHKNHDEHEGHSPDMFRRKFWLSLALTVPVVLYSTLIQDLLGFQMPTFTGSNWLPAILGTIIFFYGGWVFVKGAISEIKDRMPGMMTLISLAIVVAFGYSLATMFFLEGTEFFWELASLITIMLFGHWMEMRSIQSAQRALQELAKLLPDEAELVDGDSTKTVPVSSLKTGDTVLVRPGANIPIDGIIISGESHVDESMITGESRNIKKAEDDDVVGGTLNGDGSLRIKVKNTGEDTVLAGIMRLVSDAQASKSKTQKLADKAAFYLTFIALSIATLTMVGWLLLSDQGARFALERTVTVLIIACPHALGLAIPLVTSIATSLAAKNGLLVRDRIALESARNIDIVLFDKTGTLTMGELGVVDIWGANKNTDTNEVLRLAAAVESDSEHPIARAIIDKAKQKQQNLTAAQSFQSLSGRGVQAKVDGKSVSAGGPKLLEEQNLDSPKELQEYIEQAGSDGKSVVYVVEDSSVVGAIALADAIRDESHQAVAELHKAGMRVSMLTGDSEAVASWVAKELGIDEHFAEVLPQDKAKTVEKLQADGSVVAMVGDGVNDAPALTQADIGIAIGAGTDVAIESAGIVLASSDPRGVSKTVKLSQKTYRKMQQNLLWATGYNVLALPAAAGVFAGFGLILAPAVGAILMSLSTIIVALNAQLLRKVRL